MKLNDFLAVKVQSYIAFVYREDLMEALNLSPLLLPGYLVGQSPATLNRLNTWGPREGLDIANFALEKQKKPDFEYNVSVDFSSAKEDFVEDVKAFMGERAMDFKQTLAKTCEIVGKVYDRASEIARRYELSIKTNRTPDRKGEWTVVLEMEGDQPEYSRGFSVHLSEKHSAPESARIWVSVQDLQTGRPRQFVRETVPLAKLESTLNKALAKFGEWLEANEGVDPIEAARERVGITFYWKYEREGDISTFEADLDDWFGTITGESGDFEGLLFDKDGNTVYTLNGGLAKNLMLALEKEYKERK
jgi:hypothetical protein